MSEPILRITAAGARAVEERLLADLRREVEMIRGDHGLLRRPLWVVVPSASLRAHVAARIVRDVAPSVLGVAVLTLSAAARDILERCGLRPEVSEPLFDVLARREAMKEDAISSVLGNLRQGPGLAAASIHDLLSAGLVHAVGDPRGLLLGHAHPGEKRRALALLAAARRTARALEDLGAGRTGDRAARAAAAVRERGPEALVARKVLIHGFADATGQSADLLAALLESAGGSLYVDEPPDPARPGRPDRGVAFVRRFTAHLPGLAADANGEGPGEPPTIASFSASGADAEVRETAYRIRSLLHGGVAPEGIGVVARHLPTYGAAMRRHFTALGVPFSGGRAPAGYHPESRRLNAALELMERGAQVSVDRWLDALRPGMVKGPLEDLRLGLRALGAARLEDAARLDADAILGERKTFPLPARKGLARRGDGRDDREDGPDEDDGTERGENVPARVLRRQLSGAFLRWGVDRARATARRWSARPERAAPEAMARALVALLADELGWKVRPKSKPDEGGLDAMTRDLLRTLPIQIEGALELSWDEIPPLLRASLVLEVPVGGAGAGVQVTDVTHARGRTFDHLFLLGMNRDVFPRQASEDPLLPDAVRRRLSPALPHLHAKAEAREEERYLFASLASSAPHVTLSWQRSDEDGRERSPSPFLVRLAVEAGLTDVAVPREPEAVLLPPWAGGAERPRTARDAARLAAFTSPRSELGGILRLAMDEIGALHGGGGGDDALASTRLAILEEWEPDRRTADGKQRFHRLGPYLGFVGPVGARDPRRGPLYVTRLEGMALCPWQAFLRRVLHIEPVPDPFGALPALDIRLLGNAVHRALERLFAGASRGAPDTLAAALDAGAEGIPRPAAGVWESILSEAAADVAREEGILLQGMHRALVLKARPFVESALHHLYRGRSEPLHLVGGELRGTAVLHEGGERVEVRFRADQVSLEGGDTVVLTDFKTGRPLSEKKKPASRHGDLLGAIRSGRKLQAAAYASSRVAGGRTAAGRYLFLRPELEVPEAAEVRVSGEGDLLDAFRDTVQSLRRGLNDGVFFPRLENPAGAEPFACQWCDVTDACGRQDTSVRRRLATVADAARGRLAEGRSVGPHERVMTRLWFLGHEDVP